METPYTGPRRDRPSIGTGRRLIRMPGLAGLGLLAFLSSCGSSDMFEPIGIGPERDDLKRSPCACVELPQDYSVWRRG